MYLSLVAHISVAKIFIQFNFLVLHKNRYKIYWILDKDFALILNWDTHSDFGKM